MDNDRQNIIIYNTADGKASVSLYAKDGMVWMNQNQLAKLFDTSIPNVSMHISNILKDKELEEKSVVKEYLTTAADGKDYRITFKATQMFFAETQNKLLYAVTGKTATEIILDRANADEPNMALTSWKGHVVRKQDIFIAKNYLNEDEIDTLNRLVVIFLETAELRAKNRIDITMKFWRENVDRILEFNERPLLTGKGKISNAVMEQKVREIYELFDRKRKGHDALQADQEDLLELQRLEKKVEKRE